MLGLIQEFFEFCERFATEFLTMSNEQFWKESLMFFLMLALMATIITAIFYACARITFNRREARSKTSAVESIRAERWKMRHYFMPYGKGAISTVAFCMLSGIASSGFWMLLAIAIRMWQ